MAVVEVAGEVFAAVALLEDVVQIGRAADESGQALAFVFECALAVGYGLVELPAARRDDAEVHAGLGRAHRGVGGAVGSGVFGDDFGGVLFAVDETYLEAVDLLLKSREPWRPFEQFARGLMTMLHRDGAEALALSEDLRLAVKYFSTARAHFRRVSYMLCRRVHGSRIADRIFEEKPSPVNELAALLA